MPRSPLVRRFVAVFSSVLLLQLPLVTGGTPCRTPEDRQATSVEEMPVGHDGMQEDAPHSVSSTESVPADSPLAPHANACDTNASHRSCHVPCTPGGCALMSGCAISAPIRPCGAIVVPTLVRAASVGSARGLMPRGPTFAPEPPPPRA